MKTIRKLETEKSLEIHGLMVGKNKSIPLDMLCTKWDGKERIHTFLSKYDALSVLQAAMNENTAKESENVQFSRRKVVTNKKSSLSFSRLNLFPTKANLASITYSFRRTKFTSITSSFMSATNYRFNKFSHADFQLFSAENDLDSSLASADTNANWLTLFSDVINNIDSKNQQLVDKFRENGNINSQNNDDNALIMKERRFRLQQCMLSMSKGLIEREEEVKLLVFAVLCREHVLLLGPPGTGTILTYLCLS